MPLGQLDPAGNLHVQPLGVAPLNSCHLCPSACREVLRQLQAVCAAHAAACQAGLAAAAAAATADVEGRASMLDFILMMDALLVVAGVVPSAVEPSLLGPLNELKRLPKVSSLPCLEPDAAEIEGRAAEGQRV